MLKTLFILQLESLVIIIAFAFVMTRIGYIRNLINQTNVTIKTQLITIVVFAIFAMIGTYTGVAYDTVTGEAGRWKFDLNSNEAIINFRVLCIVAAGLIGGIWVGLGAGLIAGVHRYLLGGFTAFSCGISTLVVGIFAGLIATRLSSQQRLNPYIAVLIAVIADIIQMLIIVTMSQPLANFNELLTAESNALFLVQKISSFIIILNGVGCGLFMLIIRNVMNEVEMIAAQQAKKILNLARRNITALTFRANN